jgi:hypothetical protein
MSPFYFVVEIYNMKPQEPVVGRVDTPAWCAGFLFNYLILEFYIKYNLNFIFEIFHRNSLLGYADIGGP